LWRSAAAAWAGILVSWLAIVAVVAASVRRARTRLGLDHAFGASVTGMLLLSPITWDYAFLLLTLPVAVLWVDPPRSEPAKLLLLGALVALWMWQKPVCHALIPGGYLNGVASPAQTLSVLSYPCYALIVIFTISASKAMGH